MKHDKIYHFMRMAKFVGEDDNKCLSRKIGAVVVDPNTFHVLSTGYNGPPRKSPDCDDPEYLREVVWPQLSNEEKCYSLGEHRPEIDSSEREMFCKQYGGSCMCPRRVIGAPSGKRLELCSCAHAEKNAIVNSTTSLHGAYMFAWCGVPCFDCTKYIINGGIKVVYSLKWTSDYSQGSRYLLRTSNITLVELDEEEIIG